MNLLLVEPGELGADRRVCLAGRRARHLVRVLGVEPGRTLRAGVLGEGLGRAEVLAVSSGPRRGDGPRADAPTFPEGSSGPAEEERSRERTRGRAEGSPDDRVAPREVVELHLDACDGPPPPPPADLILALPRPKALRRILRLLAAVGVGRVDLVNAWRVERSYFASPALEPETIRRELVLGAEQGGVPRLPELRVRRFFVPFLKGLERPAAGPAAEGSRRNESAGEPDELHRERPARRGREMSALGGSEPEEPERGRPDRPRIVAHPGADATLEDVAAASGWSPEPPLLAIGPEGGWIEAELESFRAAGFLPASLGPWTLTTEHALAAALGQLALLGRRCARFPPTP